MMKPSEKSPIPTRVHCCRKWKNLLAGVDHYIDSPNDWKWFSRVQSIRNSMDIPLLKGI